MIYSTEDVLRVLEGYIKAAGSAHIFAERLGVTDAFISAVRKGRKPPSGAILAAIGYEKVDGFRYIGPKQSPEQERYKNARQDYRERNPNLTKEDLVAKEGTTQK
jgi:transcriptional regulator with XRE-family HTH domain